MSNIVIKVGTGVLTRERDGHLDGASLVRLVTAIAEVIGLGHQVVLVSSGAVGAGISSLGLSDYPEDVPSRQACAAIGQTRLMHAYQNLFGNFELSVAQLLLTADDLDGGVRSMRVKDTLAKLFEVGGIIPIINENDSVAVEELSVGDNDMLSSRVARLLGVDLLVLLTSVDGLIPPQGGEHLAVVDDVNTVLDYARDDSGRFSIGGMASKLKAVKETVDAGIETVIANGAYPQRLRGIVEGAGCCTRFTTK